MPVQNYSLSTAKSGAQTHLSTALNSFATVSAVLSATISNASDGDLMADYELFINFASAPVANIPIDLYFVRQLDGTNYEDNSFARPPATGFAGQFVLAAVTGNQRLVLSEVRVPSGDFKLLLLNQSAQTAAASGNTLKGQYYNYKF